MTKWRLPELLSSLSARVSSSKADAGREGAPDGAADQEPSRFAERPVDRSVLWLPGGWGEHHGSRPFPYELFVEQAVLREVEAHAHEEVAGSYGLLSGRLLTCRRTRIPFVHVEATHRSDTLLPEGEDLSSFREFFWSIREKAGRRGRVVVGWYHTHALLGLQLSERDRQLHVAHFHNDWSCALVVVTRHGKAEGGFFQRDRGDILFRRSTRPFHEIVNQTVRPGGGPYVTAVSWENYWSHEPVLFARQPGDPETRGGQWYWRRRDSRSRPAARILGLGPATLALEGSDESGRKPPAQSGEVEERKPAEVSYEPAMGRPRQVEDTVAEPGRPEHAGAPPADVWAQWKQGLAVRREREQERQKLEAEQAKADATETAAEADRRARARLAAQTAAEAAARAAAEALGIESDSDAVSAEAVSRAEREAADLVSRRRRPSKMPAVSKTAAETEPHESAEVAAPDEPLEPVERLEPDEAAAPAAEAPAAEAEVGTEVEAADEAEMPAGLEATRDAEEVIEEPALAADLLSEDTASKQPGIEKAGPAQLELEKQREPEKPPELEEQPQPMEAAPVDAEVEAIPWGEELAAEELAAEEEVEDRAVERPEVPKRAPSDVQPVAEPDVAEPEAAEPEAAEPEAAEPEAEPGVVEPVPAEPSPLPVRAVARSDIVQAAGDESFVPPFVLANPPRLRLRRYALWIGVALPTAAVIAWLLFG